MIDLAPRCKRGLELHGPLILAGGYGRELRAALISRTDALVTPPTSLRPRALALGEIRTMPFPGGFLYTRGGANPGLAAVLQVNRHIWRRLNVPIILSLASVDRVHWGEIARRVSRVEAISALELVSDDESDVAEGVGAVKAETDLPIIAKIPFEGALEQSEAALKSGADALTVGLAPRGSAMIGGKEWIGRLAGPPLKPLAIRAIRLLAQINPEIPLIAAGGVQTATDVQDFLSAGASAVQIDAALWRNPDDVLAICG